MICRYPNLELIEYKFREVLEKSEIFKLKRGEITKRCLLPLEFDVDVFSQMWGSTCTAFDIDAEGRACIGGCAMTKAYTVIIKEESTGLYGVFVDDKFCYLVSDPNVNFLGDLKSRNIASISEAKEKY